MDSKKYVFVEGDSIEVDAGRRLTRIRSLVDIPKAGVAKGDLGGYIEKETNLVHAGGAWAGGESRVYGGAQIMEDALVSGDAWIKGNAVISGKAQVRGTAVVSDDARIFERAEVSGDTRIFGNAQISGDAKIFGKAQVFDEATVRDNSQVGGDAWIFGDAHITGGAKFERTGHQDMATRGCKVFSAQTGESYYKGPIIAESANQALQQVSAKTAIIHNKADFQQVPSVNKSQDVKVSYLDGKATFENMAKSLVGEKSKGLQR